MNREIAGRRVSLWSGVAVFLVLFGCVYGGADDPRILIFKQFNRATTYNELKPLVSGVLAHQFADISTKPDEMRKVLNYLQFTTYDPHVVEINANTSFLVLENTKSTASTEKRAAYLLSRTDENNWTLASRISAEMVITSMWTREYSPAEFDQTSSCSVRGASLDPTLNGKQWNLASATAFRTKDSIEVDLYPFPLKQADLEYWKFWSGMPIDPSAFQSSSVNDFHAECRIIFGLNKDHQITFVNVGFNHPKPHFSAVWQGPGWAWAPPQIPKPSTKNGVPPEFPRLEITHDRIKLETAGKLESGGNTIRWKTKIDIPLWGKGL